MQLSIVSYLDAPATEYVRQLQQTLSEITGSTASLTSWEPHITLGDGIDATQLEVDDITDELQQVAQVTPPFTITISGVGSFDSRPVGVGETSTPYALFLHVAVGQELANLAAKIDEVTSGRSIWYHMPKPYLPHVTLAFRDLTEIGYLAGLEYLKDKNWYVESMIDHIALVEKTPGSDSEYLHIPLDKL